MHYREIGVITDSVATPLSSSESGSLSPLARKAGSLLRAVEKGAGSCRLSSVVCSHTWRRQCTAGKATTVDERTSTDTKATGVSRAGCTFPG